MFAEDELLPISALQHLLFCERQCALIHIEQLWAENRFTVEGQHLHRKAHAAGTQQRDGVRVARGLALRSYRLGLIGKADVVEFAEDNSQITPIEYKRGKPKTNDCDRVQLCAQAMCLEEMLGAPVRIGALFYGKRRRRTEVVFDQSLRELTTSVAERLHKLIAAGQTPLARREPKCDHCSLFSLCMPGPVSAGQPVSLQIERAFKQHLLSIGPQGDRDLPEIASPV